MKTRIWQVIDKIKGEASIEFKNVSGQTALAGENCTTAGKTSAYLEYPKGDPREPMTAI